MPFVHETPPSEISKRVRGDLEKMYATRFQVPEHPIAVFNLSGPDITDKGLASATPSLWRYYDARGLGSYAEMDGDGSGINNLTSANDFDKALLEKLSFLERCSRHRGQNVSCRLLQIHALHLQIVWELHDGKTHCFHKAGFIRPDFEQLSPDVFYDAVAREWQAMSARYAESEHAELLGG